MVKENYSLLRSGHSFILWNLLKPFLLFFKKKTNLKTLLILSLLFKQSQRFTIDRSADGREGSLRLLERDVQGAHVRLVAGEGLGDLEGVAREVQLGGLAHRQAEKLGQGLRHQRVLQLPPGHHHGGVLRS